MIFGLYKQSYNQTLNIKTDFENCIIYDVRITLMTSCVGEVFEKLRKDALGAFTFLSIICVQLIDFREIHGQCTSVIAP